MPRIVPHEDQSLRSFGESREPAFQRDQAYCALSWNVFKSKKRDWERDFHHLHPNYDLFLLQEAKINFHTPAATPYRPEYSWVFGESFVLHEGGSSCGVLTGAKIRESHAFNKHGPVLEPFLKTPKSTTFSFYPIAGQPHPLLVINTHFINFRPGTAFEKQLRQVVQVIREHQGPILFAGDFNTWNGNRLEMLDRAIQAEKLERVKFDNEERRILVLDHVFVKGLTVEQARLLPHIKSSDHVPLSMQFALF